MKNEYMTTLKGEIKIGDKLLWLGEEMTVCEVPPEKKAVQVALKDRNGRIYVNWDETVRRFCWRPASSLEGKNTG